MTRSGRIRLLAGFLALGSLIAPALGSASEVEVYNGFFPYEVHRQTLPNGLDVLVIPMPEFKDVLSYNTLVLAGNRNEIEPGKTGLAHLFEHILFRHKWQGEVNGYDTKIGEMGAFNNAYTWFDITYYHPVTFTQNLELLSELEADRFLNELNSRGKLCDLMIGDSQTVLAVIPARGGSKGLPRKNVLPLGGKPLIAWTIEAAQGVSAIDRLIVSSDDDEILAVARSFGVEAMNRDPALAGDTVTSEPVLIDVADRLAADGTVYEWIVLLQPTSPLRTAGDIEGALSLAEQTGGESVISVSEVSKPPQWCFALGDDGEMQRIMGGGASPRRQDLPTAYAPNGAVYVGRLETLRRTLSFYAGAPRAFVMPAARSVDIDSELDLAIAEAVLGHGDLT